MFNQPNNNPEEAKFRGQFLFRLTSHVISHERRELNIYMGGNRVDLLQLFIPDFTRKQLATRINHKRHIRAF